MPMLDRATVTATLTPSLIGQRLTEFTDIGGGKYQHSEDGQTGTLTLGTDAPQWDGPAHWTSIVLQKAGLVPAWIDCEGARGSDLADKRWQSDSSGWTLTDGPYQALLTKGASIVRPDNPFASWWLVTGDLVLCYQACLDLGPVTNPCPARPARPAATQPAAARAPRAARPPPGPPPTH